MADGRMRVPGQRGDRGRPGCGCCLPPPAPPGDRRSSGRPRRTERHVAEPFTMAVEQLRSDKAQVRFGGLNALERLAQDNPAYRQAIVDVICSYLRMPFSPTAPASKPTPRSAKSWKSPARSATGTDGIGGTWEQEDRYVLPRSVFFPASA